jgi:hypothetical protein
MATLSSVGDSSSFNRPDLVSSGGMIEPVESPLVTRTDVKRAIGVVSRLARLWLSSGSPNVENGAVNGRIPRTIRSPAHSFLNMVFD